jgi:hypothetical protein
MDGYISNKKNIYFVDGLEKFCRQRWRATQDLKAEAEHRRNVQEKLHLQDREEINLITTHPREIVPQDYRINIGKWEIKFNIDGVRRAFKSTTTRGM